MVVLQMVASTIFMADTAYASSRSLQSDVAERPRAATRSADPKGNSVEAVSPPSGPASGPASETMVSAGTPSQGSREVVSERLEGQSNSWIYDTAIAALGGFIGFGFALLLEQFLLARRRRECIVNIVLELRAIHNQVSKRQHDRSVPSELSYGISVPIWDAVTGNGHILDLKDRPYYNALFVLYGTIQKLARLEDASREAREVDVDELIGMRQALLQTYQDDAVKSLVIVPGARS